MGKNSYPVISCLDQPTLRGPRVRRWLGHFAAALRGEPERTALREIAEIFVLTADWCEAQTSAIRSPNGIPSYEQETAFVRHFNFMRGLRGHAFRCDNCERPCPDHQFHTKTKSGRRDAICLRCPGY